jgi:hypothetical protein
MKKFAEYEAKDSQKLTFFGSILFSKRIMGSRILTKSEVIYV